MDTKTLFGPCQHEISECLKCGVPYCNDDPNNSSSTGKLVHPYLFDGQQKILFECGDSSFMNLCTVTGIYLKNLEIVLKSNGLDVPSWQILVLLGDGCARSITFLAEKTAGKNSTITRIVQRMQKDGLVTVKPSTRDARYKDIQLTQKGECARLLAFKSANQIMTQALSNVSDAELKTFSSIAEKMAKNMAQFS